MRCSARHGIAEKIFREAGFPTTFISFTSADRYDAGCRRNYDAFFHLAGSSDQKGTAPLVDLWRAHPEWPTLTIVQHPNNRLDVQAPNITYISEHIDDEKLRRLRNEMGVHVCPSEAEGFGHSIVEAMSCRALVVTTDAPPMNEIVSADCGVLVEVPKGRRRGDGAPPITSTGGRWRMRYRRSSACRARRRPRVGSARGPGSR